MKLPLSGLQITVIAAAILLGTIYLADASQQKQEKSQRATDAAAVASEIASGQIADGFAFQQHCGNAAHMTRIGKDLSLAYPDRDVAVTLLRVHPKDVSDLTFHISFWRTDRPGAPLDAPTALTALACKP